MKIYIPKIKKTASDNLTGKIEKLNAKTQPIAVSDIFNTKEKIFPSIQKSLGVILTGDLQTIFGDESVAEYQVMENRHKNNACDYTCPNAFKAFKSLNATTKKNLGIANVNDVANLLAKNIKENEVFGVVLFIRYFESTPLIAIRLNQIFYNLRKMLIKTE